MNKSERRRQLGEHLRRWAGDRDQSARASQAICAEVRRHPAWTSARLVCAFLPLATEPQIRPLWADADGRAFCFPRVRGDDMELVRIDDPALLHAATWRFADPHFETLPPLPPETVDLFLVPGVAFTADGRRLGRGGGYYDRLLQHRRATSTALGVCFSVQVIDDLPIEAHDQRLDAVITERGCPA